MKTKLYDFKSCKEAIFMTEEMMEEITNRIIDKLNGCVRGGENESN